MQPKEFRCRQCGQSFQNEQDLQKYEAECRQLSQYPRQKPQAR